MKEGKVSTLLTSFLALRKTKYFLNTEMGLKDVVLAWLIASASSIPNKKAKNF